MRFITFLLLGLAALPAVAGEGEYKIEFYLQPDGSGQNTLNKTIELENGELTIEESRKDGNNRYVEREATDIEAGAIQRLVRERVAAFEMNVGEDVDKPRVEIKFEFEGEDRAIEVEESYPAGRVPAAYVEIQKSFFEDVFR